MPQPEFMLSDHKKYLSEFSLTPEGTAKLQTFFDENLDALLGNEPAKKIIAEKTLRTLLAEEVMPEEVLEALKGVLVSRGDHVIAIHGFPEAKGLEYLKTKPAA